MIRVLIVGYSFGIRCERRWCEEVHLNLAYRWFADWGSKMLYRITPASQRTGMAAFARAEFSVMCSSMFFSAA